MYIGTQSAVILTADFTESKTGLFLVLSMKIDDFETSYLFLCLFSELAK